MGRNVKKEILEPVSAVAKRQRSYVKKEIKQDETWEQHEIL